MLPDGEELTTSPGATPNRWPTRADVGGLVCFYQEKLDLKIDGEVVERVHTPWS